MALSKKNKLGGVVEKLKKNYSTKEIIYEFSEIYLKRNSISNCDISNLNELSKYQNYKNKELQDEAIGLFLSLSLEDLEAIFESLISLDGEKNEGVVYTPSYIIDYIIDYSLENYSRENIPIVCDPACGCGSFLVRVIEALSKKYNITIEKSMPYIKGIDINYQSVSCSKIIIELYYLSKNITIGSLDNNIICEDTLLVDRESLLKKLNIENGVDILVTNPPYVKLQNIDSDYRKELVLQYPDFTNGSFSLAMLFLVKGRELLSQQGMLGYITQNNFFTSIASKNIRELLQSTKCVHTVVDFLHTKIFENASAYTCLIFLKNNKDIEEFNFKWVSNPVAELRYGSFSKIKISQLNSQKWRLAPTKHLDNISKIENNGVQLGSLADIKVGFATLKDSVFLLKRDNSLNLEDEILRPAIKIAELNGEGSIVDKKRKIIFPYRKKGDKYIAYSEDELRELFPITYKYLLDNKDLLQTRSNGKKRLDNFYEWGRTQGMDAPSYKLLTKTFASKPNFMLDISDSLFCNGYSVKPKSNNLLGEKVDIFVLQKILNSSIMDYYLKLTSFQLDGNYQCFQKNFIELFTIPKLSNKDIKFIKNNSGIELDSYLSGLYNIELKDIVEILNR